MFGVKIIAALQSSAKTSIAFILSLLSVYIYANIYTQKAFTALE